MPSRPEEHTWLASESSAALQDDRDMLEGVLELTHDAVVFIDHDGRITRFNDRMSALTGRSGSELKGQALVDLLEGNSALRQVRKWLPGERRHGRCTLSAQSGSVRTVDYRARVEPQRTIIVFADRTEHDEANAARKSAERRLAMAAETLARVVEAAPVAIDSLDLDANVQFWNPAAEELFGWSAEEVVGGPPPGVSEKALERIREEVRSARSFSRMPVRRETRDGRMLNLSLSCGPLTDANGELVGSVGILVDETEKKATAKALSHAQKMEAIGRLAGGVAHDFNNMLSAILGFARLVQSDLDEQARTRQDVDEIILAAERASLLTDQLLTFSRKRPTRRVVLDFQEHLREMNAMIERLVGEDVVIRMHLDAPYSEVAIDPSHLEQVVMNLVINARDAMPDGGKITISTDLVVGELCPNQDCREACLAFVVRDNGVGMSDETLQKIFDPFFTTKEDGSGIGMSTVYGILTQHNAHIDVDSKMGLGTVVRILFPLAQGEGLTSLDSSSAKSTPMKNLKPTAGEILVVDDERAVRDYVEKVLSRHGYQVVVASNAGEAFLLCEEQPERFELVLTDMVMPRVGGVSLKERLEKVSPHVNVVFMSGFPGTIDTKIPDGIKLLEKPFSPQELLDFVGANLQGDLR